MCAVAFLSGRTARDLAAHQASEVVVGHHPTQLVAQGRLSIGGTGPTRHKAYTV